MPAVLNGDIRKEFTANQWLGDSSGPTNYADAIKNFDPLVLSNAGPYASFDTNCR
jgi:hypothetical protein